MTIKQLIQENPNTIIGRAYQFAKKAHLGQKRKTGEPYFNHSLATAETLYGWHLDDATVAAGLLHDVVEDTPVTREEITRTFGEEVDFLVDGVTKLSRIKYRGLTTKAENLRKMLLALSQDLRVIFIKLADRLHNMKTLQALPRDKQKRIALETDEIYAPIAYRLGMQNLSGELQDLAFPYLYPQEDRWLKKNVTEEYAVRLNYLHRAKPIVEKALKDHGITPLEIDFRAKRYSSLYRKLLRHDMDIQKIYDLVAMRIIVHTVEDCYAILGVLHQTWPPLPGRIKDYIAMPKPNSYRSLHTTVFGPSGKFMEIQIRTQQMHEEDENGIAAHWLYEQSRRGERRSPKEMTEEVKWVQQLRNWQDKYDTQDPKEFLQAMKVDFFKDRIFSITPNGDVIDLPVGSTPVDFAYQIHSDVGDTCVAAKVNDRFVPLDYELKSGDLVEILRQKNKKPSEDWLSFVKTSVAKEHIRTALKGKRTLQVSRAPTKTDLRIVVADRVGLIKDISTVIARSHISIMSFTAYNPKGGKFPIDKVECATTDKNKIEKLVLKLKAIKGVKEISYEIN